jgi:threonine dehydrogenase-like Zn-dependent dehydrogenase
MSPATVILQWLKRPDATSMETPVEMMRAAVLCSPRNFALQNVRSRPIGPTQVRVRLEGCGVCGSNLAPWEGRPWFNYPFESGAPGHEGWGEVKSIGEQVQTVKIGERVAVLSYNAFAEYDVADETNVVPLPQSLKKKPFPGEALGCAINVFRRSQIQAGQTVGVVGIGFLGALLVALSKSAGARVIAISRRPFALEIAKQMGADEIIEVSNVKREPTCDCVIEAAGTQETLDLATDLTRERGRLIIAGYHQDGARTVNMQLWNWRGLDVINAHERDPKIYVDGIREAVQAVAVGRLDPSPLYTHTLSFDKIGDAFSAMEQRPDNFLKALVRL